MDDEYSLQYGKECPFIYRRYFFNVKSNLLKKSINKKNLFLISYHKLAKKPCLRWNGFYLDFFIFTIKRG
jgi:hypothetical protein